MADSTRTFTLKFKADASGVEAVGKKITGIFQDQEEILTKLNRTNAEANRLSLEANNLDQRKFKALETIKAEVDIVNKSLLDEVHKHQQIIELTAQYNRYLEQTEKNIRLIIAAKEANNRVTNASFTNTKTGNVVETPRSTPLSTSKYYIEDRERALIEMLRSEEKAEKEAREKRIALLRNDIIQRLAVEDEWLKKQSVIFKEATVSQNAAMRASMAEQIAIAENGNNSLVVAKLQANEKIRQAAIQLDTELKAIQARVNLPVQDTNNLTGASGAQLASAAQQQYLQKVIEITRTLREQENLQRQEQAKVYSDAIKFQNSLTELRNKELASLNTSIQRSITARRFGANSIQALELKAAQDVVRIKQEEADKLAAIEANIQADRLAGRRVNIGATNAQIVGVRTNTEEAINNANMPVINRQNEIAAFNTFLATEQSMLQESINKQIAIRQFGLNSIEVAEQEHIARRRQAEESLQNTLRTLQTQLAAGTINPADAQRAANTAQQQYINTVMQSINAVHNLRAAQQQNTTAFIEGLAEQNATMRASIAAQIATARYGAQSIQVERLRANEAIRQAEVRLAREIADIQARVNTSAGTPGHLTASAGLQQAATAQRNYQQAVLQANTALNQQEAAANRANRANTNLFIRIGELVGMYRVWMFASNTLVNSLQSIPKIGIELEATFSTLLSTMGSAAGAVGAMKMLDQEAERTGITISTLRQTWRDFSASTSLAGATTESTVKMFTNLNTVITALHLSTDKAQGVFNAMAQIFNKGKVQSEELVKQLGNLLPGAFAAFADSMKIGTDELSNRMKKGLVYARDTMEEFTNYMANAFSVSFAQASVGMNASVGRMQTAFTHLGETFYNLSSGVLIDVVNKITEVTKGFTKLIKETETYDSKLTILKDALQAIFVVGMVAWINNTKLLTGALTLLVQNKAVIAIIAAGTALKYMHDRSVEASETLKDIHDRLNETQKVAYKMQGTEIVIDVETSKDLVDVRDDLTNLGKAYADLQRQLDDAITISKENPNAASGSVENMIRISRAIEEADKDRVRLMEKYNLIYAAEVAKIEQERAEASQRELEAKQRQQEKINEAEEESANKLKEQLAIKEQLLKQYIKGLQDDKEQELNIIKLTDKELERQLKLHLVTIDEYYRKKEELTQRGTNVQLKAIDAEIEAIRQALKELPTEGTAVKNIISYKAEFKTQEAIAGVERWNNLIQASAAKYKQNPIVVKAIMEVESGGNPSAVNTTGGGVGAQGLMQLRLAAMKDTALQLKDALKPDANIEAGVKYLEMISNQFQNNADKLLATIASYHAGYGKVLAAMRQAKSMGGNWLELLPKTTQNYVQQVSANISRMTGQSVNSIRQVATATKQLEMSAEKRMELEGRITELNKERINVINEQIAAEQEADDSKLARAQAIYEKQMSGAEEYQAKVEEIIQLMETPLKSGGFALSESDGAAALQAAAENFDKDFGKKLQEPVESALPALEKFNEATKKISESTTNLADVNNAMYNSALKGINIMTGAFENFIKTNVSYKKELTELQKLRTDADTQIIASKSLDAEQKKIELEKSGIKYKEAAAQLEYENTQNTLTGIRQVASASASLFNQKSKAAKALHAIEQGIAVAQMAMQAVMIAKTTANTGPKVAEGAATLVAEGGWVGFAGIAAFLAVMATLGFATAGSGSSASAEPPKIKPNVNMGTGTVLGDPEAVSESITNVVDTLDKIHAEEYIELRGINDGVRKLAGGIDNSIARLFKAGGLNVPAVDFKKGMDQVLSGIQIPTTTMAQILSNWVMNYQQFDIIRTDYGNDKYKFEGVYSELDDSVTKALHEVFQGIGESMMNAAEILGQDFVDRLKNYTFPGVQIDIMGLNGEEASKKVSGVISAMLDTAADEVFKELGKYQKLGEGMFETAMRVITDLGIVQNSFKMLGLKFKKTGLDAIDFVETLVGIGGSINKLRENFVTFFNKFYNSVDQQLLIWSNLTAEFTRLKLVLPDTREGFRQLVKDLLEGSKARKTPQDANKARVILGLAGQADSYYAMLEKAQENLFKGLFNSISINSKTLVANIAKQQQLIKDNPILSKLGFVAGDTTKDTQQAIADYLAKTGYTMNDLLAMLEKFPKYTIAVNGFLELAAQNLSASPELVTLANSKVNEVEKILKDFTTTLETTVKKAKDNLSNVISNPKYDQVTVDKYIKDAFDAIRQDFDQALLDLTKFYDALNKTINDRLTSINDFIETTSIGLMKDPTARLAAERARNTFKQEEQYDILNTPVKGETLQEKSQREIGALTNIETLVKERYNTEIEYLKTVQAEEEKAIRADYKAKEDVIRKSYADLAAQIKKDNEPVIEAIKDHYSNLADAIREEYSGLADGIREQFDLIKEASDAEFQAREDALNEANNRELEALQEQYNAKNELINESFNAEADKIREKYQLEADKINAIKSLTDSINSSLAQLRQHVKELLTDTELSPLTNAGRLAESKKLYEEALTKARTGDMDAINSVSTYLDKYLSEARNFYASSEDYQRLFYEATAQANALNVSPQSIEEQVAKNTAAMAETNAQIAANTAAMNAELKANSEALKVALKASETEQKAAEKVLAESLKEALKGVAEEQKIAGKQISKDLEAALKVNSDAMEAALKLNSKAQDDALQANSDTLDKMLEDNTKAMEDAIAVSTTAMETAIQATVDKMDLAIQGQLEATIIAMQPIIDKLGQMQADNITAEIMAYNQLTAAFAEQNSILQDFITNLMNNFRNDTDTGDMEDPLKPKGKLQIMFPDGSIGTFGGGFKFASGGAFTNSIVKKPTMFNKDQMGENGPEAILPLANVGGKLGVTTDTAISQEIVMELKALRAEVATLRAEQHEQTGALISSNYDANTNAANTIVAGNEATASKTAWKNNLKPTKV